MAANNDDDCKMHTMATTAFNNNNENIDNEGTTAAATTTLQTIWNIDMMKSHIFSFLTAIELRQIAGTSKTILQHIENYYLNNLDSLSKKYKADYDEWLQRIGHFILGRAVIPRDLVLKRDRNGCNIIPYRILHHYHKLVPFHVHEIGNLSYKPALTLCIPKKEEEGNNNTHNDDGNNENNKCWIVTIAIANSRRLGKPNNGGKDRCCIVVYDLIENIDGQKTTTLQYVSSQEFHREGRISPFAHDFPQNKLSYLNGCNKIVLNQFHEKRIHLWAFDDERGTLSQHQRLILPRVGMDVVFDPNNNGTIYVSQFDSFARNNIELFSIPLNNNHADIVDDDGDTEEEDRRIMILLGALVDQPYGALAVCEDYVFRHRLEGLYVFRRDNLRLVLHVPSTPGSKKDLFVNGNNIIVSGRYFGEFGIHWLELTQPTTGDNGNVMNVQDHKCLVHLSHNEYRARCTGIWNGQAYIRLGKRLWSEAEECRIYDIQSGEMIKSIWTGDNDCQRLLLDFVPLKEEIMYFGYSERCNKDGDEDGDDSSFRIDLQLNRYVR